MGANSNDNSGYELGELDLDIAPQAAPAAAPRPAPNPAAGDGPAPVDHAGAGSQTQGGGEAAEGEPLELAHASNDNDWRGRVDHLMGVDDDDDPLNAPEALPVPELDEVPRTPVRRSSTRGQHEVMGQETDPRRLAQELAAFGPSPSNVFGCVSYTIKVVARQRQLAGERGKVQRDQQGLKARLDEALLELGRALVNQPADQLERIKPSLDAVLMARGAAEAADQNAAETRREMERKLRELDAQLLELKGALSPFTAAEAEASQHFAQADNERKRAQALLNRVDIERRAIETAKGEVDEARDQELSSQREQREAALAEAEARAELAREAHEQARGQLQEKQREIDKLSQQRRKLTDEAEKNQRNLESAAAGAEGQLAQRLRELARAATEAGGLDDLGGDRARLVRKLDDEYGRAVERKQLYDLARKAYDRGAMARGIGLVVGTLGAATAALTLL